MTNKNDRTILREKAEKSQKARREQAFKQQTKAVELASTVQSRLQRGFDALRPFAAKTAQDPVFAAFIGVLHSKAPRLVITEYQDAFLHLSKLAHLRPVQTWVPSGKGRDSMLRSLCKHLLEKYPTPVFLWSALLDEDARLSQVVAEVAKGTSLFKLCKEGTLPVSLTRAQCHDFLQSPASLNFMTALRRVQVRAEGGDQRLLSVWLKVHETQALGTPQQEAFWLTVLRLLARSPLLDPVQIGPLCDYIRYRHRDPQFTMQGRTAAALLRDMHVWHGDLAKAKKVGNVTYRPSGFACISVDKSVQRNGFTFPEVWSISELTTSAELLAEGRDLRHCVYSYSWQIENGTTSIWSLKRKGFADSERLITVELRNSTRTIVQARGQWNRWPTPQEDKVILQWAAKNSLKVQYGSQW